MTVDDLIAFPYGKNLKEGAPTVEINLFDFHDDIYGMRAVVETAAYLRGEVRFGSVDELRSQLKRDRKRSMELLRAEE